MKKFILLLAMAIYIALPILAKEKIKTNYRNALVMAYSPANNVYEDENLKLEIYGEQLWATNKSEKTIFFDLSQCFLTHNGSSYPMYSLEQNEKNASKMGVSSSIESFLAIAPSPGTKQNPTFLCNLAGVGGYGKYSTIESPSGDFSEYDERLLSLINELVHESLDADPKKKNYIGTAYRHLTEDESVSTIGANLAYAFNKQAEEWTPVAISTWVSDLYFTPYYVEMPKKIKNSEKQGFGVKKTEAAKIHIKANSPFEFDDEKSPITVYDWSGNFKKGTFELTPTWIIKKKGISLGEAFFAPLAIISTGGMATSLFTKSEDIFYKRAIIFDGTNDNWGEMTYLNKSYTTSNFLILFNNQR